MLMFNYKNVIECPKSADFVPFIKNLAFLMDVQISVDIDESGWIFKTQNIRFEATDESLEKITKFKKSVEDSIEQYQQEANSIHRRGIFL